MCEAGYNPRSMICVHKKIRILTIARKMHFAMLCFLMCSNGRRLSTPTPSSTKNVDERLTEANDAGVEHYATTGRCDIKVFNIFDQKKRKSCVEASVKSLRNRYNLSSGAAPQSSASQSRASPSPPPRSPRHPHLHNLERARDVSAADEFEETVTDWKGSRLIREGLYPDPRNQVPDEPIGLMSAMIALPAMTLTLAAISYLCKRASPFAAVAQQEAVVHLASIGGIGVGGIGGGGVAEEDDGAFGGDEVYDSCSAPRTARDGACSI